MKPTPLTVSPRYRDFIHGRDQALERVLGEYLGSISHVLTKLKIRTEQVVSREYPKITVRFDRGLMSRIESALSPDFDLASFQIIELISRLRKTTYVLSYAGEAEAIGRALGKEQRANITKDKVSQIVFADSPSGGDFTHRVDLSLTRIKNKVLEAVQLSLVMEDSFTDALDRVSRAFPSSRKVKQPRKVLKHTTFKESDKSQGNVVPFFTSGMVDQESWDQAVKDYMADNVPMNRGPHDKTIFFDVTDQGDVEFEQRYDWEIEQETTHDFITRVRDGQVDAAKENGITDFQWVSIVDNKTDDCCLWRDGLTTSEIEQALDNGDHKDDDCDATTPPAHFNCRCRVVPVSQEMPEESPPDFGSFDDWLERKAA